MASSRRTGTNENISTYGNGTRDYTSLSTWEAATDNDLVTATTSEVLECYADSASFDDAVGVAGAITNSTYFRIIRPASGQGHSGVPGGFTLASTGSTGTIDCAEDNFCVQDICVTGTANSAGNVPGIRNSGGSNQQIVGNIVYDLVNSGAGGRFAILTQSTQANGVIANNVVINSELDGIRLDHTAANAVYVYNNTVVNCGRYNVVRNNGVVHLKNNLASGGTTADYNGTFSGTVTNNASSDATASGTGARTSQTFTFTASGSDDFSLTSGDAGARWCGQNLGADATFAFTDDLEKTDLSGVFARWSIGAYSNQQPTFTTSRRVGHNENVSTYGSGGRDYTALATWEAATDNDLTTTYVSETLECYADAASFNDAASFGGGTTNASFYRTVRAASGAEPGGIPGQGICFAATVLSSNSVFRVLEDYFSIQDICISFTVSDALPQNCVSVQSANAHLAGLVCYDAVNSGAGEGRGIVSVSATGPFYLSNCITIDCDDTGFFFNSGGQSTFCYNCTNINGTRGFDADAGTVKCVNCLSTGASTADFEGTFTSSSNNASGDATAPGTSSRTSQTFTFANAAGRDYHLAFADVGAKDFGTSLAADANFPFDDDIDEVTIVSWSIGFDSDPSAPGGGTGGWLPIMYKRRRR